jgi:hypothetical protein
MYALPPPDAFLGAGVYVVYYTGDFPLYKTIAAANKRGKWNQPIYVGKAIPAGGRKGGQGLEALAGAVLHKRLQEHGETVNVAPTLKLKDFTCRYLVVEDIFISLTESILIEKYRPVWNLVLDGFGNHDPGGGRYNQQRSFWDTLHPGRSWAAKCKPNKKSADDLVKRCGEFFAGKIKI